jgi:hypothetical protein
MVQAVLSLAYLVVSIMDAAEQYPWPAVVSVTAISFAVGLAIFRPRWPFTVPRGQVIAIGTGAIALGAISLWLTSRFVPHLTDGLPLALGGLWFSTSLRGAWESHRVLSASE